jgi:hypothetical protein
VDFVQSFPEVMKNGSESWKNCFLDNNPDCCVPLCRHSQRFVQRWAFCTGILFLAGIVYPGCFHVYFDGFGFHWVNVVEEELLFYAGILLFAWFAYKLLFAKKGVIAFDLGGVFTKGDYFTEKLSEREGMRSLIGRLKKKYFVVLLSNQNSDAHSVQIVSGRVGVKKPDPKIFSFLLKRFDAKPSETVFVDDDAANVDAAKKAGIRAVQFVSVEQLLNDFKRFGILV